MIFDEEYLTDIGVDSLPLEIQNEITQGLKQALFQRVTNKSVAGLSQYEAKELKILLSSDDIDSAVVWLHEHVDNMYGMIDKTKQEIKQEILSQKQRALNLVE